jgi:hypothetical protein
MSQPTDPCRLCLGQHFWLSVAGRWLCAACHSPASPSLVADKCEVATPETRVRVAPKATEEMKVFRRLADPDYLRELQCTRKEKLKSQRLARLQPWLDKAKRAYDRRSTPHTEGLEEGGPDDSSTRPAR